MNAIPFRSIASRISSTTILAGVLLAGVPTLRAGPPTPVRVSASAGWVSTGVTVQDGDTLTLRANGRAATARPPEFTASRSGPEGQPWICEGAIGDCGACALDGVPYGALIGRIGAEGTPFLVGAGGTWTAEGEGELFLAINDNELCIDENTGGYLVQIRH